jgi:hypothetical protein
MIISDYSAAGFERVEENPNSAAGFERAEEDPIPKKESS